ncbi:MAG: HepT-like ribonuclease domain-containing protein [Cyanobium sp.]
MSSTSNRIKARATARASTRPAALRRRRDQAGPDRDRDALGDILSAIRQVQGFHTPDRETFLASNVLQDSVVRNLEIIGEATKRHPQIPWRAAVTVQQDRLLCSRAGATAASSKEAADQTNAESALPADSMVIRRIKVFSRSILLDKMQSIANLR